MGWVITGFPFALWATLDESKGSKHLMAHTFSDLGIPPDLVQGLDALNISKPTEVQEKTIPFLLQNGGDLIAQAQTGTGKTAAFGLPLLMKMHSRVSSIQGLVLSPTRELAKQIGKQLFRYTKFCSRKLFVEVVSGGENIDRQTAALARPTQIVVATPGRLLDMLERGALSISAVKHLVMDEADEMLSMGFKKELNQIIAMTPARVSTWLFSATFPDAINELIEGCMSPGAKTIHVDKANVVNRDIEHRYTICQRERKDEFIADYLRDQHANRGLIFCRTKAGTNALCKVLNNAGLPTAALQGDLMQKERDKVMRAFKKGRVQFLVATDVAARGIDVEGLTFVLHHQLPEQLEYYTHRSGRTGRAGKKGASIALIESNEQWKIKQLETELGVSFKQF
jgi:ATP-dependent RNA helicase DeaD